MRTRLKRKAPSSAEPVVRHERIDYRGRLVGVGVSVVLGR